MADARQNSLTHCSTACTDVQIRRFCAQHKSRDMINVVHKYCENCNETIRGVGYKEIGDKITRWCERCKPDDAVSGRPKKKEVGDSVAT
jgi:hypothetical protein